MSQLTIPRPYIGGDPVLFASELSIPFSSVEDFFNDTGVGSDNLQQDSVNASHLNTAAVTSTKFSDQAISTSKIVDANVTLAKISDGAVTSAKFSDASIQKVKRIADTAANSANTGSATFLTSGTPQTVFTTPAIQCTGSNQVLVYVRSEAAAYTFETIYIESSYSSYTLRIYRSDGSLLAEYDVGITDGAAPLGTAGTGEWDTAHMVIDSPPAGSFSYYATLTTGSLSGPSIMGFKYVRLDCVELW